MAGLWKIAHTRHQPSRSLSPYYRPIALRTAAVVLSYTPTNTCDPTTICRARLCAIFTTAAVMIFWRAFARAYNTYYTTCYKLYTRAPSVVLIFYLLTCCFIMRVRTNTRNRCEIDSPGELYARVYERRILPTSMWGSPTLKANVISGVRVHTCIIIYTLNILRYDVYILLNYLFIYSYRTIILWRIVVTKL